MARWPVVTVWRRKGVILTPFTARAFAADMEDLRRALGYEQWNLYSYSYGTHVALTQALRNQAPIRSLILDSPVPMDVPWLTEIPYQYAAVVQGIFDACRADAACNAAFPTLQADFVSLLNRLQEEPVYAELDIYDPNGFGTFTLNEQDVHATLFAGLSSGELISFVPLMISELERGNPNLPAAIATTRPYLRGLGLRNSVLAVDVAPFNSARGIDGISRPGA